MLNSSYSTFQSHIRVAYHNKKSIYKGPFDVRTSLHFSTSVFDQLPYFVSMLYVINRGTYILFIEEKFVSKTKNLPLC
jgi:hypothetical protein